MGFNFTGIAINKNYQDKIEVIERILRKELTFRKEISFHEAMSGSKNRDTLDIFFDENYTIIFSDSPMNVNIENYSENAQIAEFVVSEFAMMFELTVCKDNDTIRMISEFNGERSEDYGDKLKGENDETDAMNLIFNGITNTIGHNFWSIEPDKIAKRFSQSATSYKGKYLDI